MPLSPEKIKARREAMKLSQTEAAERAGMARPNWARIEAGAETNAKLDTAEKIASALRCPLAKIIA